VTTRKYSCNCVLQLPFKANEEKRKITRLQNGCLCGEYTLLTPPNSSHSQEWPRLIIEDEREKAVSSKARSVPKIGIVWSILN
jgi:hypothetical protein